MRKEPTCRLCDSTNIEPVIDFGQQPIVHNLLRSKFEKSTLYPFELVACRVCGLMQILDFIEPEILYRNYFTLSGWKRQPHEPRLIEMVAEVFHMRPESRVLEIGCNDGTFMAHLQERGFRAIKGVEPTLDAFESARAKGLDVTHGFFNSDFITNEIRSDKYDVVVFRQVLEHIADLDDFMHGVADVLDDNGGVVIEVPDQTMNYDCLDYSLWEEHVNYFTLNTLRNLCGRHGFHILHHETTLFSGKALIVFATKDKVRDKTPVNADAVLIAKYRDSWPIFKSEFRKYLENTKAPVCVYGCGARSSTLINFLGIEDRLTCYVDDQKEKQGLFVPKSNLEIRPFDEDEIRGATILLGVNTENEHKVISKRGLNDLSSKTASILPPSRLLPEFWKTMSRL